MHHFPPQGNNYVHDRRLKKLPHEDRELSLTIDEM
tara:strand:+ start:510 stop:614 length:105 start_codon:yes stop_codon:yes gene_type:complete